MRFVRPDAHATLKDFLASDVARALIASGRLVSSTELDENACEEARAAAGGGLDGLAVVEHERIAFPSNPYEWTAPMLAAAGHLTLDLAEECLAAGYGLKDATPYNVLFNGPKPVFVDVLSFEPREPGGTVWLPYAQFVRTFLLPLAATRQSFATLEQIFLTDREGISPSAIYKALPSWRRILPPYLSLVSIPVWMRSRAENTDGLYAPHRTADPERARFVLGHVFKGLRRQLRRLAPPASRDSTWIDYEESRGHYSGGQLSEKREFVDRVLAEAGCRMVLDVGGNKGEFSMIAARHGARVVSIDSDAEASGEAWRRANAAGLDVLPLVVNFSRPSPAVGWRNAETESFLSRAAGCFDAVLMLAVMHHLVVTERIPLEAVLDVAAGLTTRFLIIEYVGPDDPMFHRLARGRDALYGHLTQEFFEKCTTQHFQILRRQSLTESSRTLYLLERK